MFDAFVAFGMNMASGILTARANRSAASSKMAALAVEAKWNLDVMNRQKEDLYASNILESYGAGIDPTTGSTRAVIENNQRVMEEEIKFRQLQYKTERNNLEAQAKQKFLGIF